MVYLLRNPHGRYYVGMTRIGVLKRLQQHNGIRPGGAITTRGGAPWEVIAYVYGFQTERQALRFERALQFPKRNQELRRYHVAEKNIAGKLRLAAVLAFHTRTWTGMLGIHMVRGTWNCIRPSDRQYQMYDRLQAIVAAESPSLSYAEFPDIIDVLD